MTTKSTLAFLFTAASALAQIGGSEALKGTVTDSSGAIVRRAVVTAIHDLPGVEHRREST